MVKIKRRDLQVEPPAHGTEQPHLLSQTTTPLTTASPLPVSAIFIFCSLSLSNTSICFFFRVFQTMCCLLYICLELRGVLEHDARCHLKLWISIYLAESTHITKTECCRRIYILLTYSPHVKYRVFWKLLHTLDANTFPLYMDFFTGLFVLLVFQLLKLYNFDSLISNWSQLNASIFQLL